MPKRSIDLTQHLDDFIEAHVDSGRFADASEIVREGLRLLEQREQEDHARLEWLRAAAKEGMDALDRGDAVTLNSTDELAAHLQSIHDEVSAEFHAESRRAG